MNVEIQCDKLANRAMQIFQGSRKAMRRELCLITETKGERKQMGSPGIRNIMNNGRASIPQTVM